MVVKYKYFNREFVDVHGLVLPQPNENRPCDNGVLFLSVAVLLGYDVTNYEELIRNCYLKKGLVARWPGNNYDQAQWDDYLGIAAACLKLKNTKIPREILFYGITHMFFFNTDGKLSHKDWLGRHVHVWMLMMCAAFPKFNMILRTPLRVVNMFFNAPLELMKKDDTSGFQLQWVFYAGAYHAGLTMDGLFEHLRYRHQAFKRYYHANHPFNVDFKRGD